MKALVIIAAVLLLFTLLFLLRVKLLFSYRDERLIIKIRILCFTFPLYPTGGKAEQPRQKKEEENKDNAAIRYLKEKLDWHEPGKLWELIRLVFRYVGRFLSGVRVQKLRLHLVIAREDAAQTAIAYGKTWAIVSSVLSFLSGYIKIIKNTLDITPDFLAHRSTYEADGIIDARIGHIILTILALGWAMLHFDAGNGPEQQTEKHETLTKKAVRS